MIAVEKGTFQHFNCSTEKEINLWRFLFYFIVMRRNTSILAADLNGMTMVVL